MTPSNRGIILGGHFGMPVLAVLLSLLAILLYGTSGVSAMEEADDPADQGPQPAEIGEPSQPIGEKHLYDMANLLNNQQEAMVESDASRLERFGIPSVIIVQASDISPEQASAFGTEVRQQWGIESEPGASDGLVMLVIVDLTDEKNIYSVMSWGDDALPHFGIDQVVADQIHSEWLEERLQDSQIYEGIIYSLRRLIYHSIYDPAPPAPLSGLQSATQTLVTWAAPLLALASLLVALPELLRVPPDRRILAPRSHWRVTTWGIPILTVVVAIMSVWSQSEIGVASSLALLTLATITWIRRDPDASLPSRSQPAQRGVPS